MTGTPLRIVVTRPLPPTFPSDAFATRAEFQLARTALRIEARDNVFCYKSPIAGVSSQTRSDIGLAFGVAYHLR